MYRLLIVDDEEIIVDGLYELFTNLKSYELDVYRAYSGNEAIEWLDRAKIDIILTDIRMPGMSGLQLLEKIKYKWPRAKVIMLTGYSEFDYIYTAIKHEGVNYILKTECDDEIVKAVEKAIVEIENSLRNEELICKAEKQMNSTLPILQKQYLTNILKGKLDQEFGNKQFKELELTLDADTPIMLLLGNIDSFPHNLSYSQRAKNYLLIDLILKENLSSMVESFQIEWDKPELVWILQPKGCYYKKCEEDLQDLFEMSSSYVKGMLETIQQSCKESLSTTISFVYGSLPTNFDTVVEKLEDLKIILNCRLGIGTEMILLDNNLANKVRGCKIESSSAIQQARLQLNKVSLLNTFLESGQKDEFFKLLTILTECLKEIDSMHYNPAMEVYSSIALIYLSYINRFELIEVISFKMGIYKLTNIDEHASWIDAVEYLYDMANIIFELQNNDQENRTNSLIYDVKKYIQDNLKGDLSLVKLSEIVYLNPTYLSRLFKQVTNVRLSDYISEARLNMAKELLMINTMKIHEIASAIGCDSPPYFTRFFKKMTNMTPQEYRDFLTSI